MKPNTLVYNLNVAAALLIIIAVIFISILVVIPNITTTNQEKNTAETKAEISVVHDNLGYPYEEVYINGHKYYTNKIKRGKNYRVFLAHAGDCECNITKQQLIEEIQKINMRKE